MNFQKRCHRWLLGCFGFEIANDKKERILRFTEESVELMQACALTEVEVLRIVQRVFSRPSGDIYSEIGGVMTTINTLCSAYGIDRRNAQEDALSYCICNTEKIREKHFNKPDFMKS